MEKILTFFIRLLNRWQNRESLKTLGAKRSSQWSKIRRQHLELHPTCFLCGGTKTLEVHHKIPFHLNPELELDLENLVTLCEEGTNGIVCHRAFGHLGNYRSFNANIIEDCLSWGKKVQNRP